MTCINANNAASSMACSSSPTGKANKSYAGILGIRYYAPTFKLIFCRRSYSLNFGGGASAFDRNTVKLGRETLPLRPSVRPNVVVLAACTYYSGLTGTVFLGVTFSTPLMRFGIPFVPARKGLSGRFPHLHWKRSLQVHFGTLDSFPTCFPPLPYPW